MNHYEYEKEQLRIVLSSRTDSQSKRDLKLLAERFKAQKCLECDGEGSELIGGWWRDGEQQACSVCGGTGTRKGKLT